MIRLFVDHLTNVDFSYLCPERGLLGETWIAHIELRGTLDEQGMVCDFGTVKKQCRNWLDEYLDHRLAFATLHENLTFRQTSKGEKVSLATAQGTVTCESPSEAFAAIRCTEINKESVAQWCSEQLRKQFGESVEEVTLWFSEEPIEGPYYHYSHGLKKHLGNCQRIAHGHRSKILIWQNGKLSPALMAEWAQRWKDIYIASSEDLSSEDDLHYHFAYIAQQGPFSLSLPKKLCYFIETDSTVEYLAQHIAQTLAQETNTEIEVKAYEGLAKGAIAKQSPSK